MPTNSRQSSAPLNAALLNSIVGNTGGVIDGPIGGVPSTNGIWIMHAPSIGSTSALTTKLINNTGAAINVKASAGVLYGITLTNETAAGAYAEFFNTAGTPVLGTTVPVFVVKMPASTNVTISPGPFAVAAFSTGIGFAATTAENGSTTAAVTGMLLYF